MPDALSPSSRFEWIPECKLYIWRFTDSDGVAHRHYVPPEFKEALEEIDRLGKEEQLDLRFH
jgi:hypothetical protein